MVAGWDGTPQRAKAVRHGYNVCIIYFLCLASANIQWRLSGSMPGDVLSHFIGWTFSVFEATGVIYSRLSKWTDEQELAYHAGCLLCHFAVFPAYSFLSPWSTQFDIQFGVIGLACAALLYNCFVIYLKAEMGSERFRLRFLYPVLCLHQTLGLVRFVLYRDAPELPIALISICVLTAGVTRAAEHIEANITRMQLSLKSEVARAEAALVSSLRSKADLLNLSNGMSSMLKALCDVVVYLDEELRIDQPTPQLYEFLMGAHGDPARLQSRCFCDFLQDGQDKDLAKTMLANRAPEAASADVSDYEGGAAGAFNVRMQEAAGGCSKVQVFFARLASNKLLLGLRLETGEPGLQQQQQQQQQHQPPEGAPPASMESLKSTSKPVEKAKVGEESHSYDIPSSPQSTTSTAEMAAQECQKPNPSRLAFRFDASSDLFTIGGQNPCVGTASSSMRLRAEALLPWVASEERSSFENWVIESVQNAPWDRASSTEPFDGHLTLTLPKVRARKVVASKAWLEIVPPDDFGDIWATLWLEDFEVASKQSSKCGSRAYCGYHLETVEEESLPDIDDDDDSETASSISLGTTASALSVDT